MDENEFLRGIEGEEQQGSDLVSGAEHLVRLKIQAGQQTQPPYEDLELKKEAGAADVASLLSNTALSGMGGAAIGGHIGGGLGAGIGGMVGAVHGLNGEARHQQLRKLLENLQQKKEKQAGDFAESLDAPGHTCKDCGKEKCACMTPKQKTASYQKAKDAIKHLMRTNPMARSAILGGAVGGAGQAAWGAMTAPPGERTSNAIRHGVMGTAVGAGTGALYHHLNKVAQPDWDKAMLAATTGAGALAGGIGTYLSSRPQADTGKSKMEEELEGSVAAQKTKPERGFLEKLKNRETESAHGISRVFREHPVKASLLGMLTGAAGGYGIGQLGGAIARRRGGK